MIDTHFCITMARYNRWQNKQLEDCLAHVPGQELTRDRKAFFGSILGTLNHLCWGDQLWMSRFDGGARPDYDAKAALTQFPTLAAWSAERFQLDGRIRHWAENLHNVDLAGDLTWYSGLSRAERTLPMAVIVPHFFNHQTHHRGQVHAMLTATGAEAPVSDLIYMPDDF